MEPLFSYSRQSEADQREFGKIGEKKKININRLQLQN